MKQLHEEHTGVLSIKNELEVTNGEELALAYTPGVAGLSKLIEKDPKLARKYTISGKVVAVITDGTAVLGLGNVGPQGGLPIVEGKALLYKGLAGVDAFPLCIKQGSIDEAVATIKNLELSFAGIHLEDIQAPACFEIEERLQKELEIPVYHDDQEGTAIVVLAGLINAAKLAGKQLTELNVVINGVGASGLATAQLLFAVGITNLTLVDKVGVLTPANCSNPYQQAFVEKVNFIGNGQTLAEAIVGHQDAAKAKLTIISAPLVRGRIATIVDSLTTIITPGNSVDVIVTEIGIAINPNRQDLIEQLSGIPSLPIISIADLKERAEKIVGKANPIEYTDKVVAYIQYRDGSLIDVVRQVKD